VLAISAAYKRNGVCGVISGGAWHQWRHNRHQRNGVGNMYGVVAYYGENIAAAAMKSSLINISWRNQRMAND